MAKVLMYTRFERFWHWTQAILILVLAFTGFEIHGDLHVVGFEKAVKLHTVASWALLVLLLFSLFWHFTTGAWRQYIPTTKRMKEQIIYYTYGIFVNAPHPTHKTRYNKFNPLQKFTYLQLQLIAFPIQGITGILYFYNDSPIPLLNITFDNLELIAFVHILGAYFFVIFLIVHVYLTTTGSSIFANIKAMITGWEEEES